MSLLLFFINTGKERKKKKNPALSVFLSIHDLQIIIVIKVILMKSKALSFKEKKKSFYLGLDNGMLRLMEEILALKTRWHIFGKIFA